MREVVERDERGREIVCVVDEKMFLISLSGRNISIIWLNSGKDGESDECGERYDESRNRT